MSHDADQQQWTVQTNALTYPTKFVVAATGCLSSTNLPDFSRLEQFEGDTYHTGRWPHEKLTSAVNGSASLGRTICRSINFIIAAEAAELTVFQRTPNYSIPAHNKPLIPRNRER